jgi:hypothetical protein
MTTLDFTAGLPDLSPLCVPMNQGNPLCIRFPGGVRVCASVGLPYGDIAAITRSLFAQVNSALTPLNPLFDIIDVAAAIVQCIQAIPDVIGPPPDPQKLLDCIPGLIQKIAKLLELLPPYCIPILVKDVCAFIANFLLGMKLELLAFLHEEQRILAAGFAGAPPGLKLVASCASGNFTIALQNLANGAGPLNRLIGDINTFGKLVGLPELPVIGDFSSGVAAALSSLDPIIQTLQEIASFIPG